MKTSGCVVVCVLILMGYCQLGSLLFFERQEGRGPGKANLDRKVVMNCLTEHVFSTQHPNKNNIMLTA